MSDEEQETGASGKCLMDFVHMNNSNMVRGTKLDRRMLGGMLLPPLSAHGNCCQSHIPSAQAWGAWSAVVV